MENTLEYDFREFLYLNDSKILVEKKKFKDVYLGGNYLLRCYNLESTIYFLTSSDSITIPNIYIDIFNLFNVVYTGKLAYFMEKRPNLIGTDKIILDSVLLARDIQSSLLYYKSQSILELVEDIVNTGGTKVIRDIVKQEIGLDIEPWVIENLSGRTEI